MHLRDLNIRDNFLATLGWVLAIGRRYPESLNFALVLNSFDNANELGNHYGAREAIRHLTTFTHSLNSSLRKTDLLCRDGSHFWILTPFNAKKESLCSRVTDVFHSIEDNGLKIVSRKTAVFDMAITVQEAPNDSDSPDPLLFLRHLYANKDSLASCRCASEFPCPDESVITVTKAVKA
jgi:hypothetical protein